MTDVVLVHPPLALPTEPPPGPAVLAGTLAAAGYEVAIIDANIEGLDWLVAGATEAARGTRAGERFRRAYDGLRDPSSYVSRGRHDARLHTVAQGLTAAAAARGPYRLSLTDYHDLRRDPFSSQDLLDAARHPDDHLFAGYVRTQLLPRVAALRPRLLGITIAYRQQALLAMAIAGALREVLPDVPFLAGGGLLSAWLAGPGPVDQLLEVFDGVVAGDGAAALRSWLDSPRDALRHGVPGLVRRDPTSGRVARTPALRLTADAMDVLPRFDGLPLGRYLVPAPVLPLAASRGCYWRRCAFCPESIYGGEGFAALPAETLRAQVTALAARHGASRIHLVDSALPPATMRSLAALPPPEPAVAWYGFARFEAPLLDPEICRGLARAGCRVLQLGLESGSQRLLDLLGKGIQLPNVSTILANLHAAGIATFVYVLIGLPSETLEDATLTRDFLVDNAAHVDFLHASVMNVPIGAPLDLDPASYLVPRGAAIADFPGDLSLCRELRSTGPEERRRMRRFLSAEILAHPVLRPIVRRMPPQLGVNHVLFRAPAE